MVLTPNAASMRQCREGHLPADPLHVRLIRVELESGEVEVLITSRVCVCVCLCECVRAPVH